MPSACCWCATGCCSRRFASGGGRSPVAALSSLAWRSLASRPVRTALALLAVALGVAVLVAVATTNASIDASLAVAASRLLGRTDVEVRSFGDLGFTRDTTEMLTEIGRAHV